MASFVDAGEAKISVLARLAVFDTVDDEWDVAGFGELGRVRVGNLLGDSLPAEPIADVIGVAIDEGHAYAVVEYQLEIVNEDWVGKVAGLLKRIVNVIVGLRIVHVDTKGLLNLRQVEEIIEISWRGRIFIGMADVINPATAIHVIRRFYVGATLVRGLSGVSRGINQ